MDNHNVFNAHLYTDTSSCLFINKPGKLIRVRCPFEVMLTNRNKLPFIGKLLIVTKVLSIDNRIYFEIDNKPMSSSNYCLVEAVK